MPNPSHPALSAGAHPFPHSHLLGLAPLKPWEMLFLLDEAEQWVEFNRSGDKHDSRLAGLTQLVSVDLQAAEKPPAVA
jgi:aspartate carbamoyltransferase catalytic subunit